MMSESLRRLLHRPEAGATISDITGSSARLYGPAPPRTLEEVERRARADPLPLRGREGGYYAAANHPGILDRQLREFEEAFGSGDRGGMPRWLVWTLMSLIPLALAGVGFFLAPIMLSLQSGAVQGAGSGLGLVAASYAGWAGLVLGAAAGAGAAWWIYRTADLGDDRSGVQDAFGTVYANVRATQVEFRDPLGRPCSSDAQGAIRKAVRRMRSVSRRDAWAAHQDVFVPAEGDLRRRGPGEMMRLFRTGDIRIETERDLRTVRTPSDLFDGVPLRGRWRGANSLRWYTTLKYALETGLLALRFVAGEAEGNLKKWLSVKNSGVIIGVACLVVGTLVLFAVLDEARKGGEAQVPDRTPAVQVESITPDPAQDTETTEVE